MTDLWPLKYRGWDFFYGGVDIRWVSYNLDCPQIYIVLNEGLKFLIILSSSVYCYIHRCMPTHLLTTMGYFVWRQSVLCPIEGGVLCSVM